MATGTPVKAEKGVVARDIARAAARLFAATGYRMNNAGGVCAFDPTFNEFGRFCDVHPNDASCRIIIK